MFLSPKLCCPLSWPSCRWWCLSPGWSLKWSSEPGAEGAGNITGTGCVLYRKVNSDVFPCGIYLTPPWSLSSFALKITWLHHPHLSPNLQWHFVQYKFVVTSTSRTPGRSLPQSEEHVGSLPLKKTRETWPKHWQDKTAGIREPTHSHFGTNFHAPDGMGLWMGTMCMLPTYHCQSTAPAAEWSMYSPHTSSMLLFWLHTPK